MGKSTASCFKIIPCVGGGDAAENDQLDVFENKSSSDKRGWSFRKKSARHRVLSNTVTSETSVASVNKEAAGSAVNNSLLVDKAVVPEKARDTQLTEEKIQVPDKTQLPVPSEVQSTKDEIDLPVFSEVQSTEDKTDLPVTVISNASETDDANIIEKDIDCEADPKASETDDVKIVERGIDVKIDSNASKIDNVCIVEKETDCKDNAKLDESAIIIIQAAVRGFLARRELLKLKKVVRLQAAVRGHLVRRHAVGALRCVQAIVKMQALVRARRARLSMEECTEKNAEDGHGSVTSKHLAAKPEATSASVEKLLQNRFASQLMESTPKTKPIRIKCDPSKPSSTWNWLERWVSVFSSTEKIAKPDSATEQPENNENEKIASLVENSSHIASDMTGLKSVTENSMPLESEENLIIYEVDKIDLQAPQTSEFSEKDDPEQCNINGSDSEVIETPTEADSHQLDANSRSDLSSLSKQPEHENEQLKPSMKRGASEQLQSDGKKFGGLSRKASNPSFIAAQSKFEELTSSADSSQPTCLSYKDVVLGGSKTDRISSVTAKGPKDLNIVEDDAYGVRVQLGGSECGTELSISSTLDSPDNRSEVGATEHENKNKIPKQGTYEHDNVEKLDIDVKEEDHQEKLGHANQGVEGSVVSDIVQKQETSTPDVKKDVDTEMERAHQSSPEVSPRSLITVPESQVTPASQVSIKAKKEKTERSSSNQKRKSSSAGKKSPANLAHNFGTSTGESRTKDHNKSGKRRNSFGSPKPEHVDQEPRESSGGSNSLPRFMQPTESARAKVHEHYSPRSSPDVQDQDYVKKRHSLPGANSKQDSSPRIQRSMSQAQQGPKERKWQR